MRNTNKENGVPIWKL